MGKNTGITFSMDDKALKNLYEGLKEHKEVARKATVAALNRAVKTANAKLQSNIIKTYNIKKSDLSGGKKYKGERSNNLIRAKKASETDLNAYVEVRGGYLTLYRFAAGNKLPNNKKGSRVKVRVFKGKNLKLSKNHFINYPNGQRGNLQIFQKRSSDGTIRRILRTTSVASMASNERVLKPTLEAAQETLEKRAAHELEYRLSKIKG